SGVGGGRRRPGAHSRREGLELLNAFLVGFELLNAFLVGFESGLELADAAVELGLAILECVLARLFLGAALDQEFGPAGSAVLLLLAALRRALLTGFHGLLV